MKEDPIRGPTQVVQAMNALVHRRRAVRRAPSLHDRCRILPARFKLKAPLNEEIIVAIVAGRTLELRALAGAPDRVTAITRGVTQLVDSALDAAVRRADTPPLTEAEEQALRRGGYEPAAPWPDSIARTASKFQALLKDSLTVEQAARLLGVAPSRIRQRIAGTGGARTLYAIRGEGARWRIPKFQFRGRVLIPGIDKVIASLPADLSPIAVHNWLTTANPELTPLRHEHPVSPLDWLRMGNSPGAAAALATDLSTGP